MKNARIISGNIHRELLLLFPQEAEELDKRLGAFHNSLDSLDHLIQMQLQGLENRSFMIYHPALTYYARDYNLRQYSLEVEGKSPSPAHMKGMIDLAREKEISRIFIQHQFDKSNAEVLAKEIGAEILSFDPLDPQWMKQMLYIAELFHSKSP